MDSNNPVKVAYSEFCKNANWGPCNNYGDDSWDPNTVYVAIMGAVGGGSSSIGSGRAAAYSVNADGTQEHKDYNDQSKNMYEYNLISDVSFVGNTIEELLCRPPKGGPTPPTPAGSYTEASGKNCYGARGGQPAHGAKDLESPPSASCGVMSIAECEEKCDGLDGCTAITVQPASKRNVNCYRKTDIDLDQCDSSTAFDTYVRS